MEKRFECKMNDQKLIPGRSQAQAVPKFSTKNVTINFLRKGIANFQMMKCNLLKKNKSKILYLQQLSSVKSGNLEVTKGGRKYKDNILLAYDSREKQAEN